MVKIEATTRLLAGLNTSVVEQTVKKMGLNATNIGAGDHYVRFVLKRVSERRAIDLISDYYNKPPTKDDGAYRWAVSGSWEERTGSHACLYKADGNLNLELYFY